LILRGVFFEPPSMEVVAGNGIELLAGVLGAGTEALRSAASFVESFVSGENLTWG
jgi:hypothetical protein